MPDATPSYIAIESLAIGGYRSFGSEIQRFPRFGKVNIFIGQNNSGKSNVLRFIHERLQNHHESRNRAVSEPDRHLPGGAPFRMGLALSVLDELSQATADVAKRVGLAPNLVETAYLEKLLGDARDKTGTSVAWYDMDENGNPFMHDWTPVVDGLSDRELLSLWQRLTGIGDGDRQAHWTPDTVQRLRPAIPTFESHLIPAIRQVGAKGTSPADFGGIGLIERLNRLQHPKANRPQDKVLFRQIQDFLRVVMSNPTAALEIPHDLDTINVELDGKTLPLEALGTGIHEVIILAAAATVLQSSVVLLEEPEMHLHPLLQKKLMRYLQERTTNQYFITTHSAALMDTPDAEVYHLGVRDGQTRVERVSSDKHRSEICADLGYHPSDLLQSNCVVWVEGPSDRIYLEWWISSVAPKLIEGIHYSVMFYGGRLASHLSADDEAAKEFILLRRLNRHGVIVMDSDRPAAGADINATKKRLASEFDKGPGHAFLTEGREIENYIEPELLRTAIARAHPELSPPSNLGKFANVLRLRNDQGKEAKANKVRVANEVRSSGSPDLDRFDLRAQVVKIVEFIVASNPAIDF